MKKLTKRVFIWLSVLVALFILFLAFDYFDIQKKVERNRVFMEESNKLLNEYSIISLGVNPHNKRIEVHVPLKEEKRNKLAYSLALIAQKHGMEDYEVIVRAVRKGNPIED